MKNTQKHPYLPTGLRYGAKNKDERQKNDLKHPHLPMGAVARVRFCVVMQVIVKLLVVISNDSGHYLLSRIVPGMRRAK